MDNQQDQPGASTPSNASRPSQNAAATPGTARKTPVAPMAQSTVSGAMSPGTTPQNENTSNAGANRQGEGQQSNDQEGNLLDTALQSGKKWIEDSGVLNGVNELPQSVKDWSNRAVSRVGDLTTTQKIVGGALLAVGIGYLATRKGKSDSRSGVDYSRQSSGSYGRPAGYQAPDASTSRRPAVGTAGRTDSGAAYGPGRSYAGGSSQGQGTGDTSGTYSGSGRSESGSGLGTGSTASGSDHGARTSENSYRSRSDDFRSIE